MVSPERLGVRPAILQFSPKLVPWNNEKFENCRIAGLTPTLNSLLLLRSSLTRAENIPDRLEL